jgi:hypothetical protein
VEDEFGIERSSARLIGLLDSRVFGGVPPAPDESEEPEPAAAAAA